MKPNKSKALLKSIMLDIPCCMPDVFPSIYGTNSDKSYPVFFVKMDKAFDPVQITHRLCSEAQANPENKRSRWIRRLTPITLVRKILGGGLEELAREVLKPHFHSGGPPRKVCRIHLLYGISCAFAAYTCYVTQYAIRPTIRNNITLSRDTVINTVARMVGPGHSVDLKNYDLLILVDVVQVSSPVRFKQRALR